MHWRYISLSEQIIIQKITCSLTEVILSPSKSFAIAFSHIEFKIIKSVLWSRSAISSIFSIYL